MKHEPLLVVNYLYLFVLFNLYSFLTNDGSPSNLLFFYHAQEMGPKPSQLAESFGLVVRCPDPLGGAGVLAQTAHTLSQALPPGGEPLYPAAIQLPFQDYKEV